MISIFLAFWCITLFLSNFNPFGLYDVSHRTYFLLLLFVISFCGGVFSCKSLQIQHINCMDFSLLIERIIINKYFLLIIIFLDAVLLHLYIKEQAILSIYSVADVRVNLDELLYEGNSFLGLIRNMFILPLIPILSFLGTYLLMYNRKRLIPLFLILFFVVVSALLGGSRGGILKIAVYCVFMITCKCIFNNKQNKSSFFLQFLKLSPIIIIILVVMSNMTAQREFDMHGFSWEGIKLGSESLAKHFVVYCVGPFRALDYSLNNNYLEIVDGYKWGKCSLGFIDGMLSLVLNSLGIGYQPAYRPLAKLVQENWIYVGAGESFNFAYTALLFYYIDLGVLGIIIFPFIFGRIVSALFNKFVITCNPMILVLLSYLFTIMIDTIFTWRLYRHQAFTTFLLIVCLNFLYKKYIKFSSRKKYKI